MREVEASLQLGLAACVLGVVCFFSRSLAWAGRVVYLLSCLLFFSGVVGGGFIVYFCSSVRVALGPVLGTPAE